MPRTVFLTNIYIYFFFWWEARLIVGAPTRRSLYHMFFVHYLGVGDADDMFYKTILLCGLKDRHTVLPILLHSLGTTIRPVLVAHFLW